MSKLKNSLIILMSAVLALTSLFLCACTDNVMPINEEKTAVTLVLDYTPNTNHLGIYVAQAKGYFTEGGLDITIEQPPDSGADALVASGRAQFGVSFQDWMASYLGSDEKLPVTAVAAIAQHNTSSILSLKDKSIVTPKDMTGKTYATMDVDIEQAILKKLVNNGGGDWSKVNIVSNNAVDEYQGLKQGMFDCVWSYDAWGVLMCKQKGEDVNAINIASLDATFDYYTPIIIVNDNFLDENSEAVQAFMEAVKKGYVYASQNPEEAANILCEADSSLDEKLVKESAQELSSVFVDEDGSWGNIDDARWSRFYQWVNDNNLTEKQFDIHSGYTNDFLK